MSATVTRMSRLLDRAGLIPAQRSASALRIERHTRRCGQPISDTHVRYADDVAARRIDREEWARQVARLVNEETDGNKSQFAALVGVTYKTVNRWLNCEVDVSEEKVREVASALHIKPVDLLVQVGYYAESDFPAPAPTPGKTVDDPARRTILATNLPPRMKKRMLQRLEALRAAQREREAEEVQWWIEQAQGS